MELSALFVIIDHRFAGNRKEFSVISCDDSLFLCVFVRMCVSAVRAAYFNSVLHNMGVCACSLFVENITSHFPSGKTENSA